eukprot:COSAG02_NODE_2762_length_8074_cov_96.690408_11_plen_75_part_00
MWILANNKIDGNDHVVADSVIFAYTSIGVEVNSPGSILHNVHVRVPKSVCATSHLLCSLRVALLVVYLLWLCIL